MKIIATCYLSQKGAFLNSKKVFQLNEDNWQKEAYQLMELDYPKFYKMDTLSKMTLLTTELLKSEGSFNNMGDDELKLVFANSTASQQTDMKFIESYTQHGSPSPSLFVYTLPNILTGELAIRNKWYGENVFLISSEFNANLFTQQLVQSAKKGTKFCLCGWVDTKVEKNSELTEECFLFLVALTADSDLIDAVNIKNELEELITNYRIKK